MTQPSPQYESEFQIGDKVHFVTLDMMGNVRSLHDAEVTFKDIIWSGDTAHRCYDVKLEDGRRKWGWANQIRKPVEQLTHRDGRNTYAGDGS